MSLSLACPEPSWGWVLALTPQGASGGASPPLPDLVLMAETYSLWPVLWGGLMPFDEASGMRPKTPLFLFVKFFFFSIPFCFSESFHCSLSSKPNFFFPLLVNKLFFSRIIICSSKRLVIWKRHGCVRLYLLGNCCLKGAPKWQCRKRQGFLQLNLLRIFFLFWRQFLAWISASNTLCIMVYFIVV